MGLVLPLMHNVARTLKFRVHFYLTIHFRNMIAYSTEVLPFCLLQETDGMTASLHETLGNSNPHYTRMAREKIAASQAARKATEARKAAMVEASWCRILQAAQ
jgi:hypothetical protein